MSNKIIFREKDIIKMSQLFENGESIRALAQNFGCSYSKMRRLLEKECETYEKSAKKHSKESAQKNGRKMGPENGRKVGPTNVKKLHKWNATHHNWVSGPEDRFYEEYLEPIFYDQNLRRQYYIKGLNHAFDFALPDYKVVIEVDGDYTHSRPGRKERDAEIDAFVKKLGWKIYRYNDADLKKLGVI